MSGKPPRLIQPHPDDSVAVAVEPIAAGEAVEVAGRTVTPREAIAAGHKVALRVIAAGEPVTKYGFSIGRAKQAIEPGEWVHEHNLATALTGHLDSEFGGAARAGEAVKTEGLPATWEGYPRADGRAGARNELWILPGVGCVNLVGERLARKFAAEAEALGLDGVFAFPHPYGCSQLGDDLADTRRLLTALARHPNAGGVLMLGLGCENNTPDGLRELLGDYDRERIRFLAAQEVEDEEEAGLAALRELGTLAARDRRQTLPMEKLCVGLKCGGSDGFSGLTANPLLGALTDRLVALGGSTLLTEVPECFGAEPVLLGRAADREVFESALKLFNDYREYYTRHGEPVSENPSPGNRAGGITTLEEKSLGCVQKGGRAPLADVLAYGQRVRRSGLSLVAAPGNDAVSVTALAAAGAQVILFTTGRGTPLGGPVPTLKVASNPELAARKPRWIDYNAGRLLEGLGLEAAAGELLRLVVEVAGGRRARNEENGERGIAIFKHGVTL